MADLTGLPATVRIGAHVYAVRVDTEAVREWGLREHNTDRFGGFSDAWVLEIVLADRYPDDRPVQESQLRETLLHELIHQCLRPGDWDADRIARLRPAEREEYTVATLTPALFGALRDNPELAAWMLARD